jgi:hypothetical protein
MARFSLISCSLAAAEPEHTGNQPSLQLARGRAGQGMGDDVLLRPLVRGQVDLGVSPEEAHIEGAVVCGTISCGTIADNTIADNTIAHRTTADTIGHYCGTHPLAPGLVGQPEHGDFRYPGNLGQGCLHLRGIDVHPH